MALAETGTYDRGKKECRNNWGWGGALDKTESGEAWLWDGIYIIDVNGRRSCTKQMLCTQSETMKTTYVKSLFTKSAVRKSINQETKHLTYKIKKSLEDKGVFTICCLLSLTTVTF